MYRFLIAAVFCSNVTAFALTPDEIIQRADEIRNPSESYLMKVRITGNDGDPAVFEVQLSGNNRTLIKTLEPVRDRGRDLLMLNEDMWAYIPNLKRAVRVSLGQKLTGQAANGDISRMRWSGDYAPSLEKDSATDWQLLLKATKKGLTYEQVRVWIQKKDFRPLRAEYLSLQGKPLKLATYQAYKPLAGRERPSEIEIKDAVRSETRSLIQIQSMEIRKIPASAFQQSNLGG